MKKVLKEACTFEDGYIIYDGEVVSLPSNVWMQLDNFEVALQQQAYLDAQPEFVPAPSLDGFERKFNHEVEWEFEIPTPLMDKKVEEGKALLAEIKENDKGKRAAHLMNMLHAAVQWVGHDYILIDGAASGARAKCDWPVLGNPLELTVDDLIAAALTVSKE